MSRVTMSRRVLGEAGNLVNVRDDSSIEKGQTYFVAFTNVGLNRLKILSIEAACISVGLAPR